MSAAPVTQPRAFKAAVNRWRWWWQWRMGWQGLVAAVALLAGLLLMAVVRPALERAQVDNLRVQVQRLAAIARSQTADAVSQRDPRDVWRDALPGWHERNAVIAKMLKVSKASSVEIDRGDYNSELKEPGIVHLKATMPLTASYEQVRKAMAGILNEVPNATVDSVELERSKDDANRLVGRLRVSFFFRAEN